MHERARAQVWDALRDTIALLDETGRIVAVNRAWREFGARNGMTDPQAGLNTNYLEHCDRATGPDRGLAQAAGAGIRGVLAGSAANFELEYPCHSPGQDRWFLMRASHFVEDGRRYVVLVHEDITERVRSREVLQASEQKYRDLAESIRDVVWTLDPQTMRFLYTSPSVRQLRGYSAEEVMAMPVEAAVMPQAVADLTAFIRKGVGDFLEGKESVDKTYTREVEMPCKDGTTVWTEVVAGVYVNDQTGRVEVRGVSRDISERKAAEAAAARHQAEVAHLARLNTMGQMSTGLAHELNQPLTAIRNYAHYCKIAVQTGEERGMKLAEALEEVDKAAARAAQIIQRMREFVRKQVPTRASIDINAIVEASLGLMGAILRGRQIDVGAYLAPNLPAVHADRVQIEQVLINLIQNAAEAMVETPLRQRGIVVRTHAGASGATVHIAVADRGCGIPPEQMEAVFEEFHTTNPDGLGLGLAISKSIVGRHGGQLLAYPNQGGGMIFEVVLPAQKGC